LNGLKLTAPVDLFLTGGKFSVAAANYGKVSLYGMESALNMLKLGTNVNLGIEAAITFGVLEQMLETTYSSLTLQVVSGGLFDEGIPRLYDTDGAYMHGKIVLGEYDWQLFASLKLNGLALPFGALSAEGVYTYNGAGIYSGHSFGASVLLTPKIFLEQEISAEEVTSSTPTLAFPIGLSFAFYDKNIDALGASVGTDLTNSTVDFRNTIRAGAALGAKLVVPYVVAADLTFAGSYTYMNHIYRDPISLIGLSVDGKLTYADQYFIGGGLILGTIGDVTWQTSSGVASGLDDYRHTFTLAQNLGYEAYLGINIGSKCRITLGMNNNKGLAMNYGLESIKDGEIKYRQKNTDTADGLFETFGVYLKATLTL
jgi:hypothetical protein